MLILKFYKYSFIILLLYFYLIIILMILLIYYFKSYMSAKYKFYCIKCIDSFNFKLSLIIFSLYYLFFIKFY